MGRAPARAPLERGGNHSIMISFSFTHSESRSRLYRKDTVEYLDGMGLGLTSPWVVMGKEHQIRSSDVWILIPAVPIVLMFQR